MRTHCPRLNLYRSEWTQLLFHKRLYFNDRNSCLRSSLAARNLETVENFAQLKELFVLVFSGETLTSDATADAVQVFADLTEDLSKRPEVNVNSALTSQQNYVRHNN